jgi:hypothetical protein
MYVILSQTPKEVFVSYIVVLFACGLLYPMIRVFLGALGKGLSRWR